MPKFGLHATTKCIWHSPLDMNGNLASAQFKAADCVKETKFEEPESREGNPSPRVHLQLKPKSANTTHTHTHTQQGGSKLGTYACY